MIAAFFLVKISMNLSTYVLLKLFHIRFDYHPLTINYPSYSGGSWTTAKVMIVYLIMPLLWLGLGYFLTLLLKRIKRISWRPRLFLTWIAFFLVVQFAAGMFASIFIVDEIGYSLGLGFSNPFMRAIPATIVIVATLIFRPFFTALFLRTAYKKQFVSNHQWKGDFLNWIFIYSWLIGFVIILPIVFFSGLYFISLSLIGTAILALPIVGRNIPAKTPFCVFESEE